MKRDEKNRFQLTQDEADFIKTLIMRNEQIIRATVISILRENFKVIGEDCIGDIYLLACEKIKQLKEHESPDGWIIVAARKVALNAVRKYNTQLRYSSDKFPPHVYKQDNVFEEALYNIWIEKGTVDKLLDLLTPHEREIYLLTYKQKLSSKEAAKTLNISDSTVRNIKRTIKKKIKSAIKKNIL